MISERTTIFSCPVTKLEKHVMRLNKLGFTVLSGRIVDDEYLLHCKITDVTKTWTDRIIRREKKAYKECLN